MKIRNGFVSNSSSSSFVMVGCEVTDKELKKLQIKLVGRAQKSEDDYDWESDAYDALDENGWLYDGERDKPILGKVLAEQSDEGGYMDDKAVTIKDVNDLAKEVKKVLGKEPKLLMGTRSC